MKILVTGGAGFIGTNLIKKLTHEGHYVVSVDNYSTGLRTNHVEGVKYVNEDISFRKRNWNPYLDNGETFDIVYHLAAISRIQPSFKNPVGYFQTNTNGTLYIVDYCVQNNIPLIYSSTSSHHGGKFKNPYTFTKDIGEEIIHLYREHYNLKSTIARFYNVYGPHQIKQGDYSAIIGKWEYLIENGQPLTIYGDGEQRRDFTHVDDIVDGLIKIQEKDKWGYTFEFGRGRNYSINEIANMYNQEKIYLDDKPGEMESTLCDATSANIHLRWYPKFNIDDYIKNYLNEHNICTSSI